MQRTGVQSQDDGILMPTLRVGAASGAAGLLFGGVVGTLRSAHPVLWASVTGIQWSLLGTSYWGFRSALLRTRVDDLEDPTTRAYISAVSGGLSAAVVGAVTRGRANILPGAFVGSAVGYLGQRGYNTLDRQHTESMVSSAAEQTPKEPFLQRVLKSKYSPVKHLTDEEYKKVLEERLLRVNAEIAVLNDDIAALKKADEEAQVQPK